MNANTPLEYAITEGYFQHAKYLLTNYRGVIPVDYESNITPILHTALKSNAMLKFVHMDQCAEVENFVGDLPLLHCIQLGMPFDVVQAILDANPEALTLENPAFLLPLCLELQEKAS